MKILNIHTTNTLSKPEDIYFMNAEDLMGTRTLEDIH